MGQQTSLLFLSEQDIVDAGVYDTERCIEVCEEVFALLAAGDYVMGGPNGNSHGLTLVFPEESPFEHMPLAGPDRRFVAMPAYLGGRFDLCGNKWYGSNAANRERGLPRSVITLVLNDRETGEPLAFMSANLISAMRTGCIPGVACRHLAPAGAETLALVGCGAMARTCLPAVLATVPGIAHVACASRTRSHAEQFATWAAETFDVHAEACDTPREAIERGDVVCACASRVEPLVVESGWFKPDALVVLVGPMGADDAFWERSRIVWDNTKLHEAYVDDAHETDDYHAAYARTIGGPVYELMDAGRVEPLARGCDLGHIVSGEKPGRTGADGRIVCITSGMAVFDVAWGYALYERARELGIGTPLTLWDASAQV